MKTKYNELILLKDEHRLLLDYIRGSVGRDLFSRQNAEELETELKKARLVDQKDFPADAIRLNSVVRICDEKSEKIMELTVVRPEQASIKDKKISVLAPVGTALIGFRKGQTVMWNVPSGKKKFLILDVTNNYA